MAAILCQGIGSACSGLCECVGAICKAPFQLCGACCQGFGKCCGESCKLATNCCSTSFCCYVTVACLLNLPPIIVGLADVPNAASGCSGSVWMLVFWILSAINIVAAFYMSVAIQRDESLQVSPSDNADSNFQETAHQGASRISHLFCYDGWMAAYILVLLGYVAWLFVGAAWFASGTMDDNDSCNDSVNSRLAIAYAFGWSFLCFGSCALCMSLCCSICYTPTPSSTPVYRPNPPSPQQSQQQPSTTAAPAAAGKTDYNSTDTTNGTSTTTKPPEPSAPPAEPPIAEAIPIYDNDAPNKV